MSGADHGGPGHAHAGPEGMLTEIDHVGVAVRDLDATVAWYQRMFGATVAHRERIESDGVEEALLRVADSYIQLLTPYTETSPLYRFMERHGEGLHHVGYRVADCAGVLDHVKAEGARVVDEHPRTGSRGTTVAFLHPKTAFGTLIELVEE
ncbi:MAG TPA: methylmalonyl-CoA epimerase [Acidimicrobiales bacterium]|nr:methylmalonyl-CoA epimerase [Acidimicrobiales bacterium]